MTSSSNNQYFVPPLPPSSSSSSSVKIIKNDKNDLNHDHGFDINPVANGKGTISTGCEEVASEEVLPLSPNESSSKFPLHQPQQQRQQQQRQDDEITPLIMSQDKEKGELRHAQNQKSTWPLPFDDESAIKNEKLPIFPTNHDLIKSQLHQTKNLSVRIITWNQHAKLIPSPIDDTEDEIYNQLFLTTTIDDVNANDEGEKTRDCRHRHHLVAVGTQECENSISKSILNPMKERWEKCCIEALGSSYVFLQGHSLQASHLAVFAHKAIIHLITDVKSHAVPTGLCNTLGNKGGIGISLNVGKSSFCFFTAHLAAHQDQIDRRTLDFELISSEIANNLGSKKLRTCTMDGQDDTNHEGTNTTASIDESSVGDEYISLNDRRDDDDDDGKRKKESCCSPSCCFSKYCRCCCGNNKGHINPLLSEFDFVFCGGDLNYRINGTRDVVDSLLEDNRHDVLVANDQLNLLLNFEKTFAGFMEGKLTFRPTYKYDAGKDVYDTSPKRRIPSWTDRILYKMKQQVQLISYYCAQKIRVSDHRPVYASFKCNIDLDLDEISSEQNNFLRSESRSEVCVIS